MLTYGESVADDGADPPPDRSGDRVPRVARHRRDRLSPGPRRSRSAAVADRRSLRRLPRRAGAVAGHGSAAAGGRRDAERSAAAARHPGAQRSARARCSTASSSASTCSPATCPRRVTITETGVRLRRRSAARPEDRAVSRSAREPRRRGGATRAAGCSTASATTAASRWCSGAAATRRSRSTCPRTRSRGSAERGAQRRRRRRARRQRLRRAARPRSARRAVRHDRPRSAGVREEQGGGRQRPRRLQGNQPARAEAAEAGRHAGHLQLLVQHQRGGVRRDRLRRQRRRAGARHGGREADAGARSSGAARRAGDLLPEMLHPAESSRSRATPATRGRRRALARHGAAGRRLRRAAATSAARAISGSTTSAPRRCAQLARDRSTREHKADWSIDEAMAFADALIADRHLEAKSVGIEVVARYRRDFTPRLLPAWKRWLADNHSANWATTDAICGVADRPAAAAASRARRAAARRGRAIATCGCGARRSSA